VQLCNVTTLNGNSQRTEKGTSREARLIKLSAKSVTLGCGTLHATWDDEEQMNWFINFSQKIDAASCSIENGRYFFRRATLSKSKLKQLLRARG
jgi:hypothetical protein